MRIPFLMICCLALLTACHTPRYVYAPSPPNNPYFKKKGDSKIAGYLSIGGRDGTNTDGYNGNYSGGYNRGNDLQAAYALTDHWALSFDHFYRKEKDQYNFYSNRIFDTSTVNYRRNITSIGAGYFTGLNKKRKLTFNVYGGMGFGKFSINDKGFDNVSAAYTRFHTAHITKWFIQPGFNFMPGYYFWCSFTTRYVFAHYTDVRTSYSEDELYSLNLSNLNNKTLVLFEPSFNMQFGIPHCPWLAINTGFSFSANMTGGNNDGYGNYRTRGTTAFLGISLNLSKINRK
jgi:hypothetical protein